MNIIVDIQQASGLEGLPEESAIREWVMAALEGLRDELEVTVRIVDEEEGTKLNEQWREAKGPTNVLSFPAGDDLNILPELLGDIVICAPVVEREAREQDKTPIAHWAHMVIHGALHLLGHDHQNNNEATIMEAIEIEKLEKLGYGNPYS